MLRRNLSAKNYVVLATAKKEQKLPDSFLMEFSAIGDLLTLTVEGKEVLRIHDRAITAGQAGFATTGKFEISDIALQILDKPSPAKP